MDVAVLIFSFISFLFLSHHVTLVTSTRSNPKHLSSISFKANLKHHSSIPFKAKPKHHVLNLVHSSLIIDRIDPTLQITNDNANDALVNLLPCTWPKLFLLVNFSIGQPPQPQLAIMDTGSEITWVVTKNDPRFSDAKIYNRFASSTYKPLTNGDPLCPPEGWVAKSKHDYCTYYVKYHVGPNSSGTRALERFAFGTVDDGTKVVNDVVFGMAYNVASSSYIPDPRFNGVFGLGSFPRQLGSKFSYCVGDIINPNGYSQLRFGDDDMLFEGNPTSLYVNDGTHYSIILNTIRIDDVRLNIDPHKLIIDSGSPLTYIADAWYPMIAEKVTEFFQKKGIEFHQNNDDICFSGKNLIDELKEFPRFTLQLAGGVRWELGLRNLFYFQRLLGYCLGIKRRTFFSDRSLLGLNAQQGYLGFDIPGESLYIQKIDCRNYKDD